MGIRKNTIKIKTALISLSDKSSLRPLLNLLKKYKIKIISSGGTYKKIKSMGFRKSVQRTRCLFFKIRYEEILRT